MIKNSTFKNNLLALLILISLFLIFVLFQQSLKILRNLRKKSYLLYTRMIKRSTRTCTILTRYFGERKLDRGWVKIRIKLGFGCVKIRANADSQERDLFFILIYEFISFPIICLRLS